MPDPNGKFRSNAQIFEKSIMNAVRGRSPLGLTSYFPTIIIHRGD
jgi:hypothetical protein